MKSCPLLLLAMGCAVGKAQFVTAPIGSLPGSSPAAIQMQGALVQSQLAAQYAMAQSSLARSQISAYMAMARSQTSFQSMMALSTQASNQASTRNANLIRMRAANIAILRVGSQTGAASPQAAAAVPAVTSVTPAPLPAAPIMNFRPTSGLLLKIDKPSFSQEGGKVTAGTVVKIKTETHYSIIYYTTDGWTPTTSSPVYSGAITINATTHLQAIAIGPNLMRSPVGHVDYTVAQPAQKPMESAVMVSGGVLRAGTPLRLITSGKEISSADAGVGDKMTLVLDEDVKVGDAIAIAKGTKVDAVVMNADPVSGGSPGDIVFEVQSMKVGEKTVALSGGETMEGTEAVLNKKEAVIKPGMIVTAAVSEDIQLEP